MTRPKKLLIVGGIIAAVAIMIGAVSIYSFSDYEFWDPRLATVASPDGKRTAYLLWHGAMMGREITLLTSQTSSPEDARWIGVVCCDGMGLTELIWSRDSSLLAARCCADEHIELKGMRSLTHGFDFQSQTRFGPERYAFDETSKTWASRNSQLEKMFTQRGGQQVFMFEGMDPLHARRLTWLEWRRWRARLEK